MGTGGLSEEVEVFRKAVFSFYNKHGRSLPWRETTDVYEILVSELMLQQTQVPRVVLKYEAFLDAFPTPDALARADFSDVLAHWQGLGYNRRAQYLQAAAEFLVDNPEPSHDELLSLKGVGPYTAAAVCVFAYNEDRAAIDVNVRRVFRRWFGKVSDELVEQAVPAGWSREWHNALMDFGSLVCEKRSPKCEECPLAEGCFALANDAFKDEPSHSQPRFLGSVRWHRGQVLKQCLDGVEERSAVWEALDPGHRSEEKFSAALEQLEEEGFVVVEDGAVQVCK